MSMRADTDVPAAPTAPLPVLKALAEPLRWRIVQALAREDLCVCHLTEDLGAPQPLISHHLRVLRRAGIVDSERWRYWTYYRLRTDAFRELARAVDSLADASAEGARTRRPCC
jgi:ArsR family transcriptional regulator